MMENMPPFYKAITELVNGELATLNSQLPVKQKTLSSLLEEQFPSVLCKDGTDHMFKTNELKHIASLLSSECQAELVLPIMIEVSPEIKKLEIICRNKCEEELLKRIINDKIVNENNRIPISPSQLTLLRKILKTTTQYVFSVK